MLRRVSPDGIRPHERVGITGNLKELGAWGEPIALARSVDRADLWQVELELPMGMSESHKRGEPCASWGAPVLRRQQW